MLSTGAAIAPLSKHSRCEFDPVSSQVCLSWIFSDSPSVRINWRGDDNATDMFLVEINIKNFMSVLHHWCDRNVGGHTKVPSEALATYMVNIYTYLYFNAPTDHRR